jgi:hypothetical protein
MKTYSKRVSMRVTADYLSERRIYRTKVVEISETRILFSVYFSLKQNKCAAITEFLLPDHNVEMTDQGHCNKFHLQGRSMRLNLMRALSYHLRLALSFSCFASVFQRNSKTLLCIENCTLLGCITASSGNFLPTFRDNLLVPFSG